MSVEINPPFRVFTDVDGEPLEDGYIHIGAVNQNPQAVPISVFWDQALTIPAAQPIRTLGGYPSRSGTPSRMYVVGDAYSISVSNKNGTLIYSDLNNRAGDAGLRQDLSNDTDPFLGAGLVGFDAGLVYASGTVGGAIVALQSILVTPERFGAIGDGTSHPLSEFYATLAEAQAVYPHANALTDEIDWAAFQSALNTSAKTITLEGDYILNRGNTRSISTTLIGAGSLDYSASATGLVISGAAVLIQDLGVNIAVGAKGVTFASAPSLSAFDVFAVYNPADFSWSPHRSYYHAGEFFRVHSVSGSGVSIYGGARDAYTIAAVDVYRIDGVSVTIDGVHLVPPAAASLPAVKITFGVGVSLSNVQGSGGVYALIEIDRCYDVSVSAGAMVNGSPNTGDEYGLIVSNSQKLSIRGGGHQASRHAIALGGGAGVVSVPCRDIIIADMTLETNSLDVGAADMHGNCDNVVYDNCIINTHANMAGRDATYRNCKIYGRANTDGAAIFGSEIVGGTYKVQDCELIIRGDINSFGAIHLFPSEFMNLDLTLIVRNLLITGTGGGGNGKIIRMGPELGETKKINVDVRGVRNELASSLCVLFIRNENDTGQLVVSNGHIVDDVYGPAGMGLIFAAGAALTGIPTREMAQRGYVDITTTVTTADIAPAQTFRYPYSKLPTTQVGISSPTGATLSTVAGQQAAPIMYTLSATQPRPAIIASANFTAGTAVRLHWQAGINEI